ncbi:hypothetical protein LCGC14_0386740 [marine sediment metagenome]|uniref:Right handed beta helix domain-containing protein n=1 Tax=marine sediment metagenome TaxID=412755 RepID=A0A0F9VMV4_9ZZZZ
MTTKTPLFVRKQSGGMFTVANEGETTGNHWWVDSGASAASDAVGFGQNPDSPFATVDYAIGRATANNGDIIHVMPGHSETKSVTGSLLALDKAGLTILGQGEGADRPTLTLSHTGAAMTISAANTLWKNFLIVCGVDSVMAPLTISATDCTLEDIEIRDAAAVEFVTGILTTNAADRLHINRLQYRGDVATGDACTIGIDLAGCDDVLIENSIFDGIASTAFVNFSVAVDNVHVRDCIFNNVGTALSLNVVDTATGSTWDAVDCWDLVGGYAFAGGSGSALAADDLSALAAAVVIVDEFHDVPGANNVLNAQINEVIGNKSDTTAAGAVTTTDTIVAYAKQLVAAAITEAAATVIIDEFHDVPAQNNTLNAQINEVIGNKTDTTAVGAVTETDTIIAYVKQIVADAIAATASLVTIDEYHDVPAQNNTLNAQINEVIGNKTDAAAAGAVTSTDTFMGYLKQIVTAAITDAAAMGTADLGTTESIHGKLGTDTELADNSIYDLLGGAGLKTDTLHDILMGTPGITTWPAAAQAADTVSLAEAIRYITANQLPQLATATSTANLTDGTIFTYTGSIEIIHLIGRMTTVHPAQANTCLLKITADSGTLHNICAAKDLTGLDEGTLLSITGTAANAMLASDGVGALAPGQANSIVATCVTSGTIKTVFGDTGNQNGAIGWEMVWRPLVAGATVT